MIDISNKEDSVRVAKAVGRIKLKPQTVKMIKEGKIKKGNALETAKIAAITAVKNTSQLIPLCHQIPLNTVNVDFELKEDAVICSCEVKACYKTGVEMEALVGVAISLLTVWDMVKYLEKDEKGQYQTVITDIEIIKKQKIYRRATASKYR